MGTHNLHFLGVTGCNPYVRGLQPSFLDIFGGSKGSGMILQVPPQTKECPLKRAISIGITSEPTIDYQKNIPKDHPSLQVVNNPHLQAIKDIKKATNGRGLEQPDP